ncbi:MAG: PTS sugar transporter subunit IIC [Lachnospiraceae bacterium]|nr:PTS sugar transporter subunit IIC [Lachnospiraceae bacterium]
MTAFQAILIILIAFFQGFDAYGTQIVPSNHIVFGFLAGLAMGDWQTGLAIGASCQLMSLGVAAIGGSSVPNYGLAAILGTAVAISSNADLETGLTIGVAVAMLYVQIDVVVKILNGFIARQAEKFCDEGKFGAMEKIIMLSPILMGLSTALPTAIYCAVGVNAVNFILDAMPAWFTGGLSIAGAALPVVGMALLLNYMPAKKWFGCVMLGFVLATYFGLSELMSGVIPVAIIGGVWAYEVYKRQASAPAVATAGNPEIGELEDE